MDSRGRGPKPIMVLRHLETASSRGASHRAVVYLGTGEREPALDALDQAYKDRDKNLPLIKLDCRFRTLCSELRYRKLMPRIGFNFTP